MLVLFIFNEGDESVCFSFFCICQAVESATFQWCNVFLGILFWVGGLFRMRSLEDPDCNMFFGESVEYQEDP